MRKRRYLDVVAGATALVTGVLVAVPSAHATFVLGTGNVGGLGDNVIVNACVGNITGPAALVQGCLNTSHTTLVDVSTSGGLTANGGQARFEELGGDIVDFTIYFDDPNTGFSGLVFNINAENRTNSNVTFTLNAVDQFGNPETPQVFNNTISGNGNNFFNLTTADGEVGLNVTVTSTQNNIVDIRQVRIAAETLPDPDPTPEPGTLALLGSAVLGLGGFARWRRKSA